MHLYSESTITNLLIDLPSTHPFLSHPWQRNSLSPIPVPISMRSAVMRCSRLSRGKLQQWTTRSVPSTRIQKLTTPFQQPIILTIMPHLRTSLSWSKSKTSLLLMMSLFLVLVLANWPITNMSGPPLRESRRKRKTRSPRRSNELYQEHQRRLKARGKQSRQDLFGAKGKELH